MGRGMQDGYAKVRPFNRLTFRKALIHFICTECGWVVGSYVENPAPFRKTVE
ncbi:hypothetical protein HNO89_002839 [Sporosarcina luteola]|nr:hypothetical protein [Sporosarcina luteola]